MANDERALPSRRGTSHLSFCSWVPYLASTSAIQSHQRELLERKGKVLTHVSRVGGGAVARLGGDPGSASHDLSHDSVLEVRKGHSDIGVVLLGEEEVPQSERLGLLLQVLHHGRVALPSRGGVGRDLCVEHGGRGDAVVLGCRGSE